MSSLHSPRNSSRTKRIMDHDDALGMSVSISRRERDNLHVQSHTRAVAIVLKETVPLRPRRVPIAEELGRREVGLVVSVLIGAMWRSDDLLGGVRVDGSRP